jgi:hypothetical protein
MITPGLTLDNPVTHEHLTFTDSAASTNGELRGFDFARRVGGSLALSARNPRTGPMSDLFARNAAASGA